MTFETRLLKLRHEIDQTDEQLAKLIVKRLQLTQKAVLLKKRNQVKLKDLAREKKICSQYALKIRQYSTKKRIELFVQALIALHPKL